MSNLKELQTTNSVWHSEWDWKSVENIVGKGENAGYKSPPFDYTPALKD